MALFLASSCATAPAARLEPSEAPPAAKSEDPKPESVIAEPAMDRSFAYYQFTLGLLAERRGDYKEALRRYEMAVEEDEGLVQSYERMAGLYLRMGRVEDAQKAAETALESEPDYVPCLVIIGGIHSSMGRFEKAAKYFSRITELDPKNKEAWIYLSLALLQDKEYEAAITALDKFGGVFPDDPVGLYYKGRIYIQMGKNAEAEKLYKDVIKRFPEFSKGYEGLALAYKAGKNLEKAAEVYRKYLESYPDDEEMRGKLAEVYLLQESYSKAIDQYKGLVEKEPEDASLHFRLGLSYVKQAEESQNPDDYQKALQEFQLLRAKEPASRRIAFYIATIFERLKLLDEAIEVWSQLLAEGGKESRDIAVKMAELYERAGKTEESLKSAIIARDMDPNDPELQYYTGLLENKLNRGKEAIESFKRAVSLNPSEAKYYFLMGAVHEREGDYENCIAAMKKAIEIDPSHANALNYLGYMYAEKSVNLKEAEEYLGKALAIEPDNGYFIDSLGWVYFKQGRFKEALEKLLTAVRNIPPDPTVLEHLGDVYTVLGENKAATDAYERSLTAESEDKRETDRSAVKKKIGDLKKKLRDSQ